MATANCVLACTMSTGSTCGKMCSRVICQRDLPQTRAACTNSRGHMARALARLMRVKTGILNKPMAKAALHKPGCQTAASMMAISSAGKAKATSVKRSTAASTQPRCCAASSPSVVPPSSPKATAKKPTSSGLRTPASNCDATSRPSASVPSQWRVLGAARRRAMCISSGGCGDHTSESSASAISSSTMPPPSHKPRWRRARCAVGCKVEEKRSFTVRHFLLRRC